MKFRIYASGCVCTSVCASKEMSREEVERRVNEETPTGLEHGWHISEDTTFKGGEPMPCQCEDDETCQHWLLNC